MAIEYTAAIDLADVSSRNVIFSPPFFAAMPWLLHPAAASAAPNGIQALDDVANEGD